MEIYLFSFSYTFISSTYCYSSFEYATKYIYDLYDYIFPKLVNDINLFSRSNLKVSDVDFNSCDYDDNLALES